MERINIAKLLKNCPSGMELYSPLFGVLKFVEVRNYDTQIIVKLETGATVSFHTDGRYYDYPNAECILFPSKDKTTWEGFQRPFKDGDILFVKATYSWIIIYKESENKGELYKYVGIPDYPNYTFMIHDDNPLCCKDDISEMRLATEEEKKKLFDAIKEHGYYWNPKTKTLEKLPEPKFKVGDRIRNKNVNLYHTVKEILGGSYIVDNNSVLDMNTEHLYELAPDIKPKFKDGDIIRKKGDYISGTITEIDIDCFYKVIYESGGVSYVNIDAQDDWELVPNKFDITTLAPFESRVLVRHNKDNKWCGSFFSHIDGNFHSHCYKYVTIAGKSYPMCIPYEGNEHLLGTTNECNEYYKNW